MSEQQSVFSVGQIADRCGFRIHQVQHAIRARGIRPIGRAGNARLFGEAEVRRIEQAIREAGKRHTAGAA